MGCSSGPLNVVYDATTNSHVPALVGFIAGKPGTEWNRKTVALSQFHVKKIPTNFKHFIIKFQAEERRLSVLSSLSQCFGPWALKPTSYTEKIWAHEEYNGGCPVSFGVPGIMFTFHTLRRPHGRLHWCGTETSTHWAGYLSGAVQSGRRAACEILRLRGKNVKHLEGLVSRKPYADRDPYYSFPIMLTPIIVALTVAVTFFAVYYL